MAELSEDLQKFLSDCEDRFESRFSDEDAEFMDYCKAQPTGPPIEERWFARQQRPFDRNDRGGRGRRDDDRRGGGDRDRSYHGRDRDYQDRDNRDFHGRDRGEHRYRDQRHQPYGRPPRGQHHQQDRNRY